MEFKQLTRFESEQLISTIRMSGDGSRIVFSTSGAAVKVYTIDIDGSDLTEVYDFQRTGSGVFVDIDAGGDKVTWCDGEGEIFIANADGSDRKELADLIPNPDSFSQDLEPIIPLPPRITADGSEVYFINMDRDPRISGVWKVHSDGSGLAQIFNYLKVSEDVFGRDGTEYSYNIAFTDGFDISGDGSTVIFGTRIFKLEEGDLDRGHAIVAQGTTFYPAGEYVLGNQPFATNKEGDRFIMYRREFNEDLGYDEINVYFVPIGTGDPVKVIGGLDIFGTSSFTQMTGDGSRAITCAGNLRMPITLVNGLYGSRIDLVTMDVVSISMAGFRFSESSLPSINWSGDRFCFLAPSTPQQIWTAKVYSDGSVAQPAIRDIWFTPDSVGIDGATRSTFSAHVSHMSDTIHTVAFEPFLNGVFQFRALTADWPYSASLRDDGTQGDPTAGDGYYTNQNVRVDLPDVTPTGDYTIRISAASEGLDLVTSVDAAPFSIVEAFTPTGNPREHSGKDMSLRNHPNPFRESTRIEYNIPEACRVQVRIFNILGMEVATLADQSMAAGNHFHLFDATPLPPGLYICRLQAGSAIQTLKIQAE